MNKLLKPLFYFITGVSFMILPGCTPPTPVPDCEFTESETVIFGGEMKLFWDISEPGNIPYGFLWDYDPTNSGENWITWLNQIVNKYPPNNCMMCEEEGYLVVTVDGHPDFCVGTHTEEFSESTGNPDAIFATSISSVPFPHIHAPSMIKVDIYSPKYDGVQSYWHITFPKNSTWLPPGANQIQGKWIGKTFKGDGTQIKIYVSNMFNLYTVTQ
jgi:hypothetical protein